MDISYFSSSSGMINFLLRGKKKILMICFFQENKLHIHRELTFFKHGIFQKNIAGSLSTFRFMTTAVHPEPSPTEGSAPVSPDIDQPQRIKFKRLDKTAKHIMNVRGYFGLDYGPLGN